MNFKHIPIDEVVLYMRRSVESTTDPDRRKNYKKLLDLLDGDEFKAYDAFENQYHEKYIVIGRDLLYWWWAGDESDWDTCSSYLEDIFVERLRKAECERQGVEYQQVIKVSEFKLNEIMKDDIEDL